MESLEMPDLTRDIVKIGKKIELAAVYDILRDRRAGRDGQVVSIG
jgi:hypothetical protein